MSSFRKPILLMGLALLLAAGVSFGQPSELYNNYSVSMPAGTVVDPGSSLLYIIDTGVNLREAVGADLGLYTSPLSVTNQGPTDSGGNYIAPNPFGVGGAQSIYNADGTLNPELINRNFITITNTHPTQAVTVHFRYFNDECLDVLDFLVLLTCNDTLIFNPFDFNIPGTSFNSQTRIFGPAVGLFTPIPASDFASGRFLIFATAAGTSYEPNNTGVHDDNAEFRFPYEFRDISDGTHHCDNLNEAYFGIASGLVQTNLHVFNASAVAFNYLIGSLSTAIPVANAFQAYAVNAWTRPAIEYNDVHDISLRGAVKGTGTPLLDGNDFRILTGTEIVRASNGIATIQPNALYLRNDVHGGDTSHSIAGGPWSDDVYENTVIDYTSYYGALGITSLFGAAPEDQLVHFLSIVDDYNGSRHSLDTPVAGVVDRSYNLTGAETIYVLQAYDNDEILFDLEEDTPINISPPPFEAPNVILKIVVKCLRTWVTDIMSDATSVDDLQISDLGFAPGLVEHLTKPAIDPQGDVSQGWIRFVRDNSHVDSQGNLRLYGTWALSSLTNDAADVASFATIGMQVVKLGGFGAAWYLSSAASLPLVSDTGDPQCDGLCPYPTQQ